ncbi:MAG: ABC transporter permease [Lachnospiraceae bacterium]|nr:ABC transporter permease [Lachnospiraceae bacterium]
MNFKILKKDLRRKKSMNVILLVFIFLATTFIAASLNNLVIIMNGMDYFFEKAKLSDFIMCTLGGEDENNKKIREFLENQKNVTRYEEDEALLISTYQFQNEKGEELSLNGSGFVNSVSIRQQYFFDENNERIMDMEEDEIYLQGKVLYDNALEVGDSIYIQSDNGFKKRFRIKGRMKDAFLGSNMMGVARLVVNEQAFKELQEKSDLPDAHYYSVFCDDLDAFEQDYNSISINVVFNGDQKLIRTTYIMDMVITAVLLIVSFCLILIAVIMLRFTIIFSINEDYREIGIMKAIGIPNRDIRFLYLTKYFVLAVAGAVMGFFASIPFSQKLLYNVTDSIVVENSGDGLLLEIGTSILVVGVVVWFAYLGTGRIKKMTPMDAIRSGNNGERFEKKGVFRLSKSRFRATTFIAANDVLSELKKYFVLLVTSMVGVWLVVMPINTINTLQSEEIAKWFAITDCDFWVVDDAKIIKQQLAGEKEEFYDYLAEVQEQLEKEEIPVEHVATEIILRMKAQKDDYSFLSLCFQGLGTKTDEYLYDEGEPPVLKNEVAITHLVAEKLHAEIGDTIYIAIGDEERPFVVTALYQSMNNMGEGIRFPEETELDYSAIAGAFGVQVTLKGEASKEEVADAIKKAEHAIPEADIKDMREFIDDVIGGVSEQIQPFKVMILILMLLINILVVVLMQKMFLIREQGEMGMLKAIGFSNGAIVSWQTKRIMLVLFIGILLGTITGTPFSQITSGQVFKIMGASRITFQIHPVEVYGIYPVTLFVTTVLACVMVMQKVRKISPQIINEVE